MRKEKTVKNDLAYYVKLAKNSDFDKNKTQLAQQTIEKYGHPDFDKPAKAVKATKGETYILPFTNGQGVGYVVEVKGNQGNYAAKVIKDANKNKSRLRKKTISAKKQSANFSPVQSSKKKKSTENVFVKLR